MDDVGARPACMSSRFELAPPRRFVLPALLLLLSERPGYGYELLARLSDFHFGHIDRPAVYRALAQLEADGLAQAAWQGGASGNAVGGGRRVYHVTPLGELALRSWMGVVKEEHDNLDRVLRRYRATGTADAVLAEVGGGWASPLSTGWSPVSSTSAWHRRLVPLVTGRGDGDLGPDEAGTGPSLRDPPAESPRDHRLRDYRLVPERSVVLVEARSTVGPLSFGAIGVTGSFRAAARDGHLETEIAPSGRLDVDVSRLSSGNSVYDAELRRRIDARRFPTATVELAACTPSGPGALFAVEGEVTFHGTTRPARGTVSVELTSDGKITVTGEQVFDMRDFAVPSPTVLMLRIYPDVRVRLHVEARPAEVP